MFCPRHRHIESAGFEEGVSIRLVGLRRISSVPSTGSPRDRMQYAEICARMIVRIPTICVQRPSTARTELEDTSPLANFHLVALHKLRKWMLVEPDIGSLEMT